THHEGRDERQRELRVREPGESDAEGNHPDGGRADLTEAADEPGGDEAAADAADSLSADEDAHKGGRPVQALIDVREDRRLCDAHDPDRDRESDRRPEQRALTDEVPHAGDRLAEPVQDGRLRPRLGHRERAQRQGAESEAGHDEDDELALPEQGVQGRAAERSDEPQALAYGLQRGVTLREQLLWQDRLDECVESRAHQDHRRSIEDTDDVDDPDVLASADQEQGGQGYDRRDERGYEKRLAAKPVHDPAEHRRGEGWCDDREDGQAGQAVRSGEVLDPDGEDQQEGGLAHHGRDDTGEEAPKVLAAQYGSH